MSERPECPAAFGQFRINRQRYHVFTLAMRIVRRLLLLMFWRREFTGEYSFDKGCVVARRINGELEFTPRKISSFSSQEKKEHKMYKTSPYVLSRSDMLLNTETGRAYTMNPTASIIWQLLQQGRSPDEIIAFFKLPADAGGEILKFIEDLQRQGFIE